MFQLRILKQVEIHHHCFFCLIRCLFGPSCSLLSAVVCPCSFLHHRMLHSSTSPPHPTVSQIPTPSSLTKIPKSRVAAMLPPRPNSACSNTIKSLQMEADGFGPRPSSAGARDSPLLHRLIGKVRGTWSSVVVC